MENDVPKKALGGVKAIAIEILIIISLTGIVIFVLNFLKIIDINSLFTSKPVIQPAVNTKIQPNKINNQGTNKSINNNKPNPVQPNLNIVAKNKALVAAQTTTKFEGKLISIDTKSGIDSSSSASYSARLEVGVGSGTDKVVLLYPKEALSKIKIQDINNKILEFKDLKSGDKVLILTNTGIFRVYPNNINSVVITKQ